ncbi:MAG: hypothetical protein QF662_09105, partial [Phycisphaerae bacterium]|nr:hypothetical protein [Phycisphaerae bacterium]
MRGFFGVVFVIFATALAAGPVHSATPQEVASTVILANTAVPASVEVARYYAKKRGIPEENICYLKTSAEEIITRKEYESQIAGPVAAFLHRWGGGLTVKL